MAIDDIIPIEEGILRKIFEGNPSMQISRESIIYVDCDGKTIVSLFSGRKYAEFEEDLRDTSAHGPNLKPLLDFLRKNNYETNLK